MKDEQAAKPAPTSHSPLSCYERHLAYTIAADALRFALENNWSSFALGTYMFPTSKSRIDRLLERIEATLRAQAIGE